jgi:4-hydroxy-2-oxoheptanedioate aldolase
VKCPTGIHCFDAASALQRAEQGMQFLAIGSDLLFMSKAAQEMLTAVRPEGGKKDVARY